MINIKKIKSYKNNKTEKIRYNKRQKQSNRPF